MRGKVLIADGVATSRILLKAKMVSSVYEVGLVASAADLLAEAARRTPALILLAGDLPDQSALETCRLLRRHPVLGETPLIVLVRADDAAARLALLQAGADEVFDQPLSAVMLHARMRSLVRARTGLEELALRDGTSRTLGFAEAAVPAPLAPAARVALLAPDPGLAASWQAELAPHMGAVQLSAHGFCPGQSHIDIAPTPDVFVIGLQGSEAARGLRVLADMRANPDTRHSGLIAVLDAGTSQSLAADALDLGAADLMMRGFDARELALRLTTRITRKQTQDRLRDSVRHELRAAVLDPMTGLFNRRYALPYMERLICQSLETGRDFAVMLADLDHFKRINDRYGHAAGDAVLIEAARRLKGDLRAEDLVARVGGEEFLIVLPDTGRDAAQQAAERLRDRMRASRFDLPEQSKTVRITISIGVAVGTQTRCPGDSPSDIAADLLRIADLALYEAKDAGRNKVALVDAA